jgi:hypothetical protein
MLNVSFAVQGFNAWTLSGKPFPIGSADAEREKRSQLLDEVSPAFVGGIRAMPGCVRDGV